MFPRSLAVGLLLTLSLASCAEAPTTTAAPRETPSRVQPAKVKPEDPRRYVKQVARSAGYDRRQWRCLDEIIHRESRWNPKADNPTSTAYGLFQQLRLNPNASLAKMTRLGLKYIRHRYGNACAALAFHDKNGWY